MIKRKCYTHNKPKTSIKLWISTEKRVIKFKKEAWQKPYSDMKRELRKNFKK